MKSKPVKDSITIVSRLMRPTDANLSGLVHGGTILKIVDTIAYICAYRHAGKRVVTASVDKVNFFKPIEIGQLVTFCASVNHTGRTSMEVGVRVESEDLKTGKKIHTNSCYVTMVALDKKGKPTPVPKVVPQTKEEKSRFKEAEQRQVERLKHLNHKRRK